MEHSTADTPTRVSPTAATGAVTRLRAALSSLGIPDVQLRQIIPTADLGDGQLVRLGTWDLDTAHRIAEALEAGARPPLIGRPDAPPTKPARS